MVRDGADNLVGGLQEGGRTAMTLSPFEGSGRAGISGRARVAARGHHGTRSFY